MGATSDPTTNPDHHQQPPPPNSDDHHKQRSEIYTYEAPWHIYAMNWSVRPDKKYRLAIASLLEQNQNRVEIVQLDDSTGEIKSDPSLSFDHPYPPTKAIFIPDKDCSKPDLLATSSDYLRIWSIDSDSTNSSRVELKSLLNGNKNSEFCGPLTSFDWNEAEPRRIGTSSIDTTCTIWDIERETVDTQLIAHDKEVYDIAWGGAGVFASVSADGSVRVFDLRDKEHSTIIYESSEPDTPLVRLGWNMQDPRYMATIIMDSPKVVVLDIRFPTLPVVELQRHQASANAIAWAPHSSCHICTAGQLPNVFLGGIFDIVDLRLIPWGNALISPNGSFICQFGPDECTLNTVQACAIDVWEPIDHTIFIICVEDMVQGGNHTKWETCFEKTKLDSKPVVDCLKSGTGKKLELGYANQTAALKPPHEYVPWVVVDGKPIYEKYADFISFICKAYKGPPPPACKKESLASFSRKKTDHVDLLCYTEQTAKKPSS